MISPTTQPALITLDNLSVFYNDVKALCDVNLEVYKGDFLGICGPNGSGKTTLLKVIMGLLPTAKGRVIFHDEYLPKRSHVLQNVGYVPQLENIDPNFPALVRDVVMMGRTPMLGMFRQPKRLDKQKIDEAMQAMDILELSDRPIGQLSGGQLQRAMVARALAQEPSVLLLDEPTSAMDFKSTVRFMNQLRKINEEQQLTIMTIHHDLQLLKDYATRIICMDKTLEWVGKPNDSTLDETLMRLFFYKSPH